MTELCVPVRNNLVSYRGVSRWEWVEARKDPESMMSLGPRCMAKKLLAPVRFLLNKPTVNPFADVKLGCLALPIKCYA